MISNLFMTANVHPDVALLLARREAVHTAIDGGPGGISFGLVLLAAAFIIGVNVWKNSSATRREARQLDNDKAKVRREWEENSRVRQELAEARQIIAILKSGAYVPTAEVDPATPVADVLFGAAPVQQVAPLQSSVVDTAGVAVKQQHAQVVATAEQLSPEEQAMMEYIDAEMASGAS